MQSRKVYIGCATKFSFPETRKVDILMLPFYSGYRDENTQKLTITTNYGFLLDEIDLESLSDTNNLSVALRTSDIAAVRNSSETIHAAFELQEKEKAMRQMKLLHTISELYQSRMRAESN